MSLDRLRALYDEVQVLTTDNLKDFQMKMETIIKDSFDEPTYRKYKLKIHNVVIRATMEKMAATIEKNDSYNFEAMLRKDYTSLVDVLVDDLHERKNLF